MNVVDNLNSVKVINKPCVCSSTMRLSSVCGLHGDDAKQLVMSLLEFYAITNNYLITVVENFGNFTNYL
jgi:hypothetical protein